jgi:hypothetical protein
MSSVAFLMLVTLTLTTRKENGRVCMKKFSLGCTAKTSMK